MQPPPCTQPDPSARPAATAWVGGSPPSTGAGAPNAVVVECRAARRSAFTNFTARSPPEG